jgi:hypothetical protein
MRKRPYESCGRQRTSPADHEEQSDCEQSQAAEELSGDHQESKLHWNIVLRIIGQHAQPAS